MPNSEEKRRSDVNPFVPIRYPIIGVPDLVDVFSYLLKYLEDRGVIVDLPKFMDSFDVFIETKGSCKATIQVREYNAPSNSKQ